MATLFLDFEGGNDNHAGTSFAPLASGTNGRISSTTFSSSGASFPDDGSLIGQYLSIFNGAGYAVYNITAYVSATSLTIAAISGGTALANQTVDRQYYIGGRWKSISNGAATIRTIPGDTIRIMGSPAPTSLGQNGVWTSQALQATKSITGATNATPISITCTGHGYSTGDTVVITGDSGNIAANGTWEITVTGADTFTLDGSVGNGTSAGTRTARLRNNTRVKLASAVTQNIASTGPGRTAWVGSANVSATVGIIGNTKEHANNDSIAIAAAFTTGLAAYWATPSTLDLSGYQQVSFWIQQPIGTIGAAGSVDLRLCSDAAGVTAVNTISIPALGASGRWMPVTVDLGTALGSSIQSIALYVNTDNGAQTFLLSNIIACKASSEPDSLTLTSLIGKNTTGETWLGIQSINGTRVMLDAGTNNVPTDAAVRGYYGTSETVTTWKRETIKLGPAALSSTTLQVIQEAGTDGSPITYSGGWDRTAMSTQNLETWLDGVNGNGIGISNSNSFIDISKVAFTKFFTGLSAANFSAALSNYAIIAVNNCSALSTAAIVANQRVTGLLEVDHVAANAGPGISVTNTLRGQVRINGRIASNGSRGINLGSSSADLVIQGVSQSRIVNNGGSAILASGSFSAIDLSTQDNASQSIDVSSSTGNTPIFLKNCLLDDSPGETSNVTYNPGFIYSQNHDQTADNHKIFTSGALISSAIDQRKTASGISWKIQPTSTTRSANWPVPLSLAKVACAANSLVTIKAWMRRSDTGLTMRLVCKGGQIAGVASDVVDAMTAAADTWAEQTITFTPTETGVVEITAEAWGGTTFSGWVDDMTISQA